jgi:cyclophilin family peptidyl-prolyl cis-trans isomerase
MNKNILLLCGWLFVFSSALNAKSPMAVRSALDGKEETPINYSLQMAHPATYQSTDSIADRRPSLTPGEYSSQRRQALRTAQINAEREARRKLGEAEWTPTSATPETPGKTAEQLVAVITTKFGKIVIALNEEAAPKTVANFKKLVGEGFYDGTTFHRVIPNFMIQGGDPNSKSEDRSGHGTGGPGYTLPAEIKLKHTRGAVAMARLPDSINPQKESSGSQFFICVVDVPHLDDNYTVFGNVISGMDVADKIVSQPRDARDNPTERIEMQIKLEPKPADSNL